MFNFVDFRISNKHFHDYRPINEERSKLLDKMLNELKKCLPTANYIIGGGNAIPLLLRVYHKSISKTHNTDRADKIIESWIPPNVKYINGSYRDSNFVPHIICTEDNLEILVREADKAKMTLERRPKDVTIWPRIKLENYQATTIEEIKKRSKDGTRDILSSNSLRLVQTFVILTFLFIIIRMKWEKKL